MAKWRWFAERELPRVVRDLGLPAALPPRDPNVRVCPLHEEPLGSVTRMCESCHRACWDEIAHRYRAQGRPVQNDQPEARKENSMTTLEDEPLEGELVDDQPGTALAPYASTLYRTSDPKVALQRMREIAKEIIDVIDQQKLYARISGKKYVTCPGWKTIGGMCGLSPYTVWTKPNESGDGYIARVEIRTVDERTIAAAEAECARDEDQWKNRPKHSLRSMSETRATSRAFRGPLEQIVVLAGYEPTAAEELPAETENREPDRGPLPPQVRPSKEQTARISELIAQLAEQDPDTDWPARAREIAGVPKWDMVTTTIANQVIRGLEQVAR